MSAIPAHYPPTDEHYQLSPRARNWPTRVAVLVFIPNLLFWLLIEIKNAGFETLPYVILHLSNQYESIVGLSICIATCLSLFAMGVYVLDPIRSKNYRINLLICTLVFIFINLYGVMSYTFVGSKQFETVSNLSVEDKAYHLVLMDNASCNNAPCTVAYWYRLYQCDSTDSSCQIAFESEKLWRWLGEPNTSAHLQSDSANNNLQVIVDDKVIYSDRLVR
jgi:hypothetical protein